MIKYFYVSKKGAVRKKELFSKLRNYGDLIGADQFLEELARFAKLYDLIINKGKDDFIEYGKEFDISFFQIEYNALELNRNLDAINLFGITQSYPLILKAFDAVTMTKDSKERESLAKQINQLVRLIENYHFVNTAISQRPGNEVEKFYADMCEVEINANTLKNIIDEIKSKFASLRVGINEFSDRFKELNYQTDYKLIFYINDRLNNRSFSGGQIIEMYDSDSKALRRNFDIEHLVAQNASSYEIDDNNIEKYEEIVHNVGNLIVVSKHTNGSLQNKHLTEKLPILGEKEIKLKEVKILLEEWSDKHWTTLDVIEKNISERAEKMAARAYKEVWIL